MMHVGKQSAATAVMTLSVLAACAPNESDVPQPKATSGETVPSPESPTLRAAHEAVSDPENTFVDELGLKANISIDHPFLVHPGSADFPTGPAIGERLPEFTLPNQHGEMVDFQEHHEGRKAVLVFYRSAVW